MTDQDQVGCIQLIKCISSKNEQENASNNKSRLEINHDATKIITEQFESPISILVYMGSIGAGKSKLASLTAAHLHGKQFNERVMPFSSSGDEPYGATHGVWMWNRPLKHRDPTRRGSILLLDCEGMNGIDPELGENLYLICMILSSTLAIVLQRPRIEIQQWNHLEKALERFQTIKTPSVLPETWLVPLELPSFNFNETSDTAHEWINRIFNPQASKSNVSTERLAQLQRKHDFIRSMLPTVDAINLTYLPHQLKNDQLSLNKMIDLLGNRESQDYHNSLQEALNKLLQNRGKRLPGSTSNSLYIRPAELAQLMEDLIDVINGDVEPDPDQLIGQYLIKHFNDEIVGETQAKFEKDFLSFARAYAVERLKQKPIKFQEDQINTILSQERSRLINDSVKQMKRLAEQEIYGAGSILLSSPIFTNNLDKIRTEMESYTKPATLINHIRRISSSTEQEEQQTASIEIDNEIRTITGRIAREISINQSIKGIEVQCQIDQCLECHRPGGTINLIHECANGRTGNLYRYINNSKQIVCSCCRKIIWQEAIQVHCTRCHHERTLIRISD